MFVIPFQERPAVAFKFIEAVLAAVVAVAGNNGAPGYLDPTVVTKYRFIDLGHGTLHGALLLRHFGA
jgi:hypothetical protein